MKQTCPLALSPSAAAAFRWWKPAPVLEPPCSKLDQILHHEDKLLGHFLPQSAIGIL